MQQRGEKSRKDLKKVKKIRLKLLKCEKAENKFKILAKSQKVTHPSRISHYIMVAEVKKPKKATWLKKVKAEKLNVLSSRNSITWPRRCAGGKKRRFVLIKDSMPWSSQFRLFCNTQLDINRMISLSFLGKTQLFLEWTEDSVLRWVSD